MAGVLFRIRLGVEVFGANTKAEGRELDPMPAGSVVEVDFNFSCLLAGQDYTVTAATQRDDGSSQHRADDAVSFTVINSRLIAGLASLPVEVSWSRS